jgi:hypothetical protein
MRYTIYTTVDITNTGQYRHEPGKEADQWKEQNFQTILQTLGIRTNVSFENKPSVINTRGDIFGFNTANIIKVWVFEFTTERDYPFGTNKNLVEFLETDFEAVPYISGLDESMQQNYDIFVTEGPSRNIIFKLRE